MNKLKKDDLIKARKLCKIFRFIYDLNSVNDGGEFESSYSKIYPEELKLAKENTDKNKASFLYLNNKTKNGMFHFGFFDKRDSFHFSIVKMQDNSSNVRCSIVYFTIGGDSLRIARVINNSASFFTGIKPLIPRMSRQGVFIIKISSVILRFFNKYQGDFNNVFKVSKNC